MQRNLLNAKIHRVTVTQADLNHVAIGADPAVVPDGFGLEASGKPRGQQ